MTRPANHVVRNHPQRQHGDRLGVLFPPEVIMPPSIHLWAWIQTDTLENTLCWPLRDAGWTELRSSRPFVGVHP